MDPHKTRERADHSAARLYKDSLLRRISGSSSWPAFGFEASGLKPMKTNKEKANEDKKEQKKKSKKKKAKKENIVYGPKNKPPRG